MALGLHTVLRDGHGHKQSFSPAMAFRGYTPFYFELIEHTTART
jgi:hypothetical protein